MKNIITDEFQKVESTLVSEVNFMEDQLQSEVQQDIRAVQHALKSWSQHQHYFNPAIQAYSSDSSNFFNPSSNIWG